MISMKTGIAITTAIIAAMLILIPICVESGDGSEMFQADELLSDTPHPETDPDHPPSTVGIIIVLCIIVVLVILEAYLSRRYYS